MRGLAGDKLSGNDAELKEFRDRCNDQKILIEKLESDLTATAGRRRGHVRHWLFHLNVVNLVDFIKQALCDGDLSTLEVLETIDVVTTEGGRNRKDATVVMDTEEKYSEQYENKLDPFRRFNQAENQRSYTRLKIHDRASLSIGRAILTSASARMTFFFYFLILHLMVFLVLYRFAYTESCERDFQQDCIAQFERHMQQHHPDV
uniref:Protein CASP n=1 Tax=Heterorhabditis bacteriophora TaxID=37862 RepID=A0A1I7XTK9_HETBA